MILFDVLMEFVLSVSWVAFLAKTTVRGNVLGNKEEPWISSSLPSSGETRSPYLIAKRRSGQRERVWASLSFQFQYECHKDRPQIQMMKLVLSGILTSVKKGHSLWVQ